MTITLKQATIGNYHAELAQATRWGMTFYEVSLCWYGREINQNIYALKDEKNAKACFYRYTAKARKEARQ